MKITKIRTRVKTFHHNLIIDQLNKGILIYNDNTGEDMQVSYKLLGKILRGDPLTLDHAVVIKSLCKYFTYDQLLFDNEIIINHLGSDSLKNQFYRMRKDLKKVFNINNYSDYCLLSESLCYAKKEEF